MAGVTGEINDGDHGFTEPRLFTPPLRPLTSKTTKGFEVIGFARMVLGANLWPWQQWLLLHALELNLDGSYRFRRVIVEVARQNGKTTLAGVLAAYWLFVDSMSHPDMVPANKFLVVGAAQTLDNAKGPYGYVKSMCDPAIRDDDTGLVKPDLQALVRKVSNVNGEEAIILRDGARYIVRAANNIRSKSAARVIFDELREQHTEDGWNAVSQTVKAVWSSQLWGISNAGDYRSIVLKKLVDAGRQLVASWNAEVKTGERKASWWAEHHDVTLGYFSWSAPAGCALDDPKAVLQANPSIGYGPMTVKTVTADTGTMTEAAYRTEALCQWVTADVKPYLPPDAWKQGIDDSSSIPDANRVVLAVDTSADRKTTYVAAAGLRADGLPHVETIARRDGMMWVPGFLDRVRKRWPQISEVAVQTKGCPAVDFADPLAEAGWTVHGIEGFRLGACCGRFLDRVREGKLRHPRQPAVEQQASVAITRALGEVRVWDRKNSAMQISALVAESEALYALETFEPNSQPATSSAYESHGLMVV